MQAINDLPKFSRSYGTKTVYFFMKISLRVFVVLLCAGLWIWPKSSDLFLRVGAQVERPKPIGAQVERPKPTLKPTPKRTSPTPKSQPAPQIEMVNISGGSFLMGSSESEAGREKDESPQHRVTVSSFAIGKYEVTQAQWQAVMGNNPSSFKGHNLPVENVSWNDAKNFCRKLSRMTGKTYRLPTEAEWEYACRAKTTGAYAGELDTMAWYTNNSGGKTHPVGQKQPNAFGIFDMHGNVWEWCEDVWHDSYNGAPSDGSAWLSGGGSSYRVLRGGSWTSYGGNCRSAYRYVIVPGLRLNTFGFRVVVSVRTSVP